MIERTNTLFMSFILYYLSSITYQKNMSLINEEEYLTGFLSFDESKYRSKSVNEPS